MKAGAAASQQIVDHLQKYSVFSIEPFDTRAAIEVAAMTRDALTAGNKRGNSSATWAKVKYDRQIVAIAKVHGATGFYSYRRRRHRGFGAERKHKRNQLGRFAASASKSSIGFARTRCRCGEGRRGTGRISWMSKGKSTGQPGISQVDGFIETARALGCDEDKERFEAKLGEIARHKPPPPKPKKPKTNETRQIGGFFAELHMKNLSGLISFSEACRHLRERPFCRPSPSNSKRIRILRNFRIVSVCSFCTRAASS